MPKTQDEIKEILIEVKTAVLGIEGTDEKGMAGDIKEIKQQIKKQNGKIMKNRIIITALIFFLAGVGVLEGADVIHLFGG